MSNSNCLRAVGIAHFMVSHIQNKLPLITIEQSALLFFHRQQKASICLSFCGLPILFYRF